MRIGITFLQMGKQRLQVITAKVPRELAAKVARLAKQRHVSKSQVVRDAIESFDSRWPEGSVGEVAGHLFGSVKGGPKDLATNPKYFDGYGEWRRK